MKNWSAPEVKELDVKLTENGRDPSPWETRFAFNDHEKEQEES